MLKLLILFLKLNVTDFKGKVCGDVMIKKLKLKNGNDGTKMTTLLTDGTTMCVSISVINLKIKI